MINSFKDEYFFLSNFFPIEVTYKGITYPSVEHAYQAQKAWDDEVKKEISKLDHPAQAKKAGRVINCRIDWNAIKVRVMKDLVTQKFQNPTLKKWLIETGDRHIVEGNTHGDVFWGVCNKSGKNMLGNIIMDIRATLLKEQKLKEREEIWND